MAYNTILIKRRLPDSPLGTQVPTLCSGELAFNEVNSVLYYGASAGTITIGGSGSFIGLTGSQTVSGNKTFLHTTTLSSITVSPSSTIDLGLNVISNVAEPILDDDVANKKYVDKVGGDLIDVTEQIDSLSAASTLFETLTSDVTVGAISASQIIPAFTSLQDFAEKLLFKVYTPTYSLPDATLSFSGAASVEVGSSLNAVSFVLDRGSINGSNVNGVWSPSTSQNFRSGIATKYIFNGVDNGTTSSYTSAVAVVLGNNTISGTVEYSQGPQPVNSKNQNFETPLNAGSLNRTATVSGQYRSYFGTTAQTAPTDVQIRTNADNTTSTTNALRNNRLTGTFTNVSFSSRYWYLALPTIYDATPTVTINGLPNTAFTRTVISGFTNAHGVATNYALYRGDNLLTGTCTFIIS